MADALIVILAIHVLAGVFALVAGLAAIGSTKGGLLHRRAGTAYVAGMGIVVTTALPLAVAVRNWFLFAIAIFSGYLVFGGYRVILRRRADVDGVALVDLVGHGGMVAVGAGMLLAGGWGTATGSVDRGPVLAVFGLVACLFATRSLLEQQNPARFGSPWFETHVAFMGGGYVATVTAAVTVNLTMLPPVARWLGPTLVGAPLIAVAIRWYRPRYTPTASAGGN